MIHLSAQFANDYSAWQLATAIRSFLKHGVAASDIHVIGAVTKCVPISWRNLIRTYRGVRWFFYPDNRSSANTVASIQPHVFAKHWEEHSELTNEPIFVHDFDIVLTQPLDLTPFVDGPTWYLSDTQSYIGVKYIKSKEYGIYEGMCELMGIDPAIPETNDAGAGGAQYVLKGVTAGFWRRVEKDAEAMSAYLRQRNREIRKDPATPEDYWPIQAWTAEMWAMLWGAWRAGHETVIVPELDFAFATDRAKRWDEVAIFHNAGVTPKDRERLFFKGDYTHQSPYGVENYVDPKWASHRYLNEVLAAGAGIVTGAVPCF